MRRIDVRQPAAAGAADGEWLDMVLINGFTAGTTAPQYMKDSRGLVHLRGLVVAPGGQTSCWVAPAGYLPLIDAGSVMYFDWPVGGNANPSRAAFVTGAGVLSADLTAGGLAGAAGAIGGLDRICWQA